MSANEFTAFENRFRKMWKHSNKWARRQNITCFRIYDADLPDFPLSVDRYNDSLHVAEYERFDDWEEADAEIWWRAVKGILSVVSEIPVNDIHIKVRRRQKGKDQYEKVAQTDAGFWVEENGLKFWVNLKDYLDSGLFLDHRQARKMVMEQAAGKRVLNLFAYTGSFSVYAAAGGAAEVHTLDMSNTYLAWAEKNMRANGFEGKQYDYLATDAKEWLQKGPRDQYDIIILDPPTFSNSKKMYDNLDVQRDHPFLIYDCMERLAPGGFLLFSNNFRKFKLTERALAAFQIKDISSQTVPPDFRNKKIHRCYLITHPE